jgi:CHAT domain-containing protein/Tfp pilus assembly protein PilF
MTVKAKHGTWIAWAALIFGVAPAFSQGTKRFGADQAGQYQRVLDDAKRTHDQKAQISALQSLGDFYRSTSATQKATGFLNEALALEKAIDDQDGEAKTLTTLGGIDNDTGHPEDALEKLKSAITIVQKLGDRETEANALTATGEVYFGQGDSAHALELYKQALGIQEDSKDTKGKVITEIDIGAYYWSTGASDNAITYYNQAIAQTRQIGDPSNEAVALQALGAAYDALNMPQKALDCYQRAVPLEEETSNRRAQAITLDATAKVYQNLGEPKAALPNYSRAATVEHQIGASMDEAITLMNIGTVYHELGQLKSALQFYNKALTIQKKIGDQRNEAITLNDMGAEYQTLRQPQKALSLLNEALPLEVHSADEDSQALTRWRIAMVQDSPQGYLVALSIAQAVKDLNLQGKIDDSLMRYFSIHNQPDIAVFFGKEGISAYQQIRANMEGLDTELQKSFLASKADTYRYLANILINQGRLPEAQQVLDLLKEQEYRDYTRTDTANTLSPPSLTLAEQQAEDDYQKSTALVVSLGEQWAQLKKIPARTPQQEQQFNQISDQLSAANQALNDYYARLYALFGRNSLANRLKADVSGNVSELKDALANMPRTVALYTLVSDGRYSVIVVTASTAVARGYAIAEKDLDQKVEAFQQVLRNPHSDARPLAAELYKILIGPVKSDLDQSHAQTLIWSLDGVLRYVPIAALFDGKQYLVENYSTLTITPESIQHLSDKPNVGHLSVAAMGISQQYEKALPPLPAVVSELDNIVKDTKVQGAKGVLPGTILLNSAFTEKSMESELDGKYSVVHIASHFVFAPGDDGRSYLLLAGKDQDTDGFHLTVANFRDEQNLSLRNTDLLTLSACETGIGGYAGNGLEVDGLGATAQRKGAKAVISSLWEVNDASTGVLMADFYRRWANGAGNLAKVDALRLAQLDLLKGKIMAQSGASDRGLVAIDNKSDEQGSLALYAHPYYWAPFVLMGNGR